MSRTCTHCGNTQHQQSDATCCVCGYPLDREDHSIQVVNQPAVVNTPQVLRGQDLYEDAGLALTNHRGLSVQVAEQQVVTLGSSHQCDLVVPGVDIKPTHARLTRNQGILFIQAYFASLVLVNGRALDSQPRQLVLGDRVQIGRSNVFQVVAQNRELDGSEMVNQAQILPRKNQVVTSVVERPARPDCDLYGVVRHVEGPLMEDPDPSLSSSIAKLMKAGLILWKPPLMVFMRQPKQVQVRYIRVETEPGNVRAVKAKGNFVTGMISIGDNVRFWGEWRGGTLLMHRAYNETLSSNVYIMQR